MSKPAAPSIVEIVALPLLGIVAVELLHTRANELWLFCIPFLVVVIRLYLVQFQAPRQGIGVPDEEFRSAARNCVIWNQLASPVLLVVECAAVVAANPETLGGPWIFVVGAYALYVRLRFVSRRYWLTAATDWGDTE